MNLLTDDWIPVQKAGKFRHISLKRLLCQDEDWQLSQPRDDMELAALQLIVCLVQVVFMPDDGKELQEAWQTPMREDAFEKGIQPYLDWFDLLHEKYPFMQLKGFQAGATPIQKLFVGLPEGNNHSFFNEVGEVTEASLIDVTIALFNQNSNAPGFSGKQKAGIRGATPITTLIKDEEGLRKTVWVNVLTRKFAEKLYADTAGKPVWVEPIVPIETIGKYIKETKPKTQAHRRLKIPASEIGLTRGIFWLPVLVELLFDGSETAKIPEFKMGSDFYFEIEGSWPHPHSPRRWKAGEEDYCLSFTTTAPVWTQLNSFLIKKDVSDQEGHSPAPVVSNYRDVFFGKKLNLIVGGYRNKQALILERRHEMFSLQEGWGAGLGHLDHLVNLGIECKNLVRKKLYGLAKNLGVKGLASKGENLFYTRSESLMHSLLRNVDWKKAADSIENSKKHFAGLSKDVFDDVVQPYEHDPKMLKRIVTTRASLQKSLMNI